MPFNTKTVIIHIHHYLVHPCNKIISVLWILFIFRFFQFSCNLHFHIKYFFGKRLLYSWLRTVLICTKIFKISAPVKNQKLFFIKSLAKQILAKSCSTTYHLPEFSITFNLFKENKICNLRNINTRVKHIHWNCYLRHFIFITEIVNKRINILDAIVNFLDKIPTVFGKSR